MEDGICSKTAGNSSCLVSSAAGNCIFSDATRNGPEPFHTGNGICSNARGNISCSVPGATGNGFCSNTADDGS